MRALMPRRGTDTKVSEHSCVAVVRASAERPSDRRGHASDRVTRARRTTMGVAHILARRLARRAAART